MFISPREGSMKTRVFAENSTFSAGANTPMLLEPKGDGTIMMHLNFAVSVSASEVDPEEALNFSSQLPMNAKAVNLRKSKSEYQESAKEGFQIKEAGFKKRRSNLSHSYRNSSKSSSSRGRRNKKALQEMERLEENARKSITGSSTEERLALRMNALKKAKNTMNLNAKESGNKMKMKDKSVSATKKDQSESESGESSSEDEMNFTLKTSSNNPKSLEMNVKSDNNPVVKASRAVSVGKRPKPPKPKFMASTPSEKQSNESRKTNSRKSGSSNATTGKRSTPQSKRSTASEKQSVESRKTDSRKSGVSNVATSNPSTPQSNRSTSSAKKSNESTLKPKNSRNSSARISRKSGRRSASRVSRESISKTPKSEINSRKSETKYFSSRSERKSRSSKRASGSPTTENDKTQTNRQKSKKHLKSKSKKNQNSKRKAWKKRQEQRKNLRRFQANTYSYDTYSRRIGQSYWAQRY